MLSLDMADGIKGGLHALVQKQKGCGAWFIAKCDEKDKMIPHMLAVKGWGDGKTDKAKLRKKKEALKQLEGYWKPVFQAAPKEKKEEKEAEKEEKEAAEKEAEQLKTWNKEIDELWSDDKYKEEFGDNYLGNVPAYNVPDDQVFDTLEAEMIKLSDSGGLPSIGTVEYRGKVWFLTFCDENVIKTKLRMRFASLREQIKSQLDGIQKGKQCMSKGDLSDVRKDKI